MKLKIVVALLLTLVTLGSSGAATDEPALLAKISQLLSADGYSYTQPPSHSDVWRIERTAKTLKNFKVIVAASNDSNSNLVVIFVTVVRSKDMRLTPEFMTALLHLNDGLDRIKVGIDRDGDLFVRTDVTGRILDAQELRTQIEQVATSANEVYEAAQPYLSR